ncbi:endonuclease subunit [uncultured Caudovirales phage]|uniref:Endonuclease subunit n=1 Tax=uncultured Caudovirales phage TaxID=2100421 RepID=A0A6J5KKC5_9CAUD|nr:endonuclease subunit [uncultured Caudovirales phage]CAB4123906.1 endonuclease subunit [uncultured Caudovirales phage]CAB5219389.1 endonuclease subunit [uncultured Caudovirales phage]
MKFNTLEIENFLTIGKASLSLADKGLVLVQGSNLDDPSAKSNGAGKSSIVDALCWVLYGETARGVSGDAVVNVKAKKDCLVSVDIVDGDKRYLISRHRKHELNKNALHVLTSDGGITGTDITKGTDKETQVVVEQILGCSYEVFISAIYAGQEKMPDIPSMTDKQLKLLIEEAAGVTRLSQAYELARGELLKQGTTLETAKTAHETALVMYTRQYDTLKDFEAKRDSWSAFHANNIKEKKAFLVEKLKALKTAIDDRLDDASFKAIISERHEINDKVAEISKGEEPKKKLEAQLAELSTKHALVKSKSSDAVKAIGEITKSIEGVGSRTGEKCSECGKPYTEHDGEELINALQSKLDKANEALEKTKAAKTLLDGQEAILRAEIDKLPTITFGELMTRGNELADAIADAVKRDDRATLARRDANEAKKHLDELEKAVNPHEDTVSDFEKKLAEAKLALDIDVAKIADLDRSLELYRDTVKVFSPAGVRAHVLDTVTPFLNDRTAHYLGILSDGNISAVWSTLSRTAKGEIREKFSIDVENDKGAESFGGMSGGEKRKVRLACALALQDLVSSRATKSIEMWIGDEVDHALDDAGLERLMSILNDKAKEKGTVLVISHNSLTDWIDNVATITKKDGYSEVEGALS